MFDILEKFSVFSEINEQFKQNIKLFHVFDEKNVFIVTNNDKVFAFGSNNWGKCGFGHDKRVDTPQEIPELNGKRIKQFFIGNTFVLALNENNHVFGWGLNTVGELGRGYRSKWKVYLKPVVIPDLENIIEISCGSFHSLALDEQGNVFSWGSNLYGQVGCGEESGYEITRPVELKELPKLKSIHCYNKRSFAVTFDGLVYSWGENSDYCLGHKLRDIISKPELICGLNNVISVGSSDRTTYFLTNEENFYFYGKIASREDSDSDSNEYQLTPKILETNLKFQSIQTIYYYSNDSHNSKVLALSEETVYCLERNTINETKYKTFFDYCSKEKGITFETIYLKFDRKFFSFTEIESGGFGKVFKVNNADSKLHYAVKMIELKTSDEVYKDKLMKEVHLLSKCNTDYVVEYTTSWFEINKFYIQMELCSNNLKNIIEEKRKCFERTESQQMDSIEYYICSHLMKEILECVQYLHESDPPIIHRDLKPGNILVNYEPNNGRFLKLCDFGHSTVGSDKTISLTRAVGTPKYIAPEVLDGKGDRSRYSTRADIYSLGKILCDLFDFNINSSNQNENQNCKELRKQVKAMLVHTYNDRPTCAQLLSSFRLWSNKETKLEISKQFKLNLKQMKEFENQFFFNYFIEQ